MLNVYYTFSVYRFTIFTFYVDDYERFDEKTLKLRLLKNLPSFLLMIA